MTGAFVTGDNEGDNEGYVTIWDAINRKILVEGCLIRQGEILITRHILFDVTRFPYSALFPNSTPSKPQQQFPHTHLVLPLHPTPSIPPSPSVDISPHTSSQFSSHSPTQTDSNPSSDVPISDPTPPPFTPCTPSTSTPSNPTQPHQIIHP
ncbi:hypothetical protein S83_007329 [Arachis hypogaea]